MLIREHAETSEVVGKTFFLGELGASSSLALQLPTLCVLCRGALEDLAFWLSLALPTERTTCTQLARRPSLLSRFNGFSMPEPLSD